MVSCSCWHPLKATPLAFPHPTAGRHLCPWLPGPHLNLLFLTRVYGFAAGDEPRFCFPFPEALKSMFIISYLLPSMLSSSVPYLCPWTKCHSSFPVFQRWSVGSPNTHQWKKWIVWITNRKQAETWTDILKDNIPMANKHMKMGSAALASREMEIKKHTLQPTHAHHSVWKDKNHQG